MLFILVEELLLQHGQIKKEVCGSLEVLDLEKANLEDWVIFGDLTEKNGDLWEDHPISMSSQITAKRIQSLVHFMVLKCGNFQMELFGSMEDKLKFLL